MALLSSKFNTRSVLGVSIVFIFLLIGVKCFASNEQDKEKKDTNDFIQMIIGLGQFKLRGPNQLTTEERTYLKRTIEIARGALVDPKVITLDDFEEYRLNKLGNIRNPYTTMQIDDTDNIVVVSFEHYDPESCKGYCQSEMREKIYKAINLEIKDSGNSGGAIRFSGMIEEPLSIEVLALLTNEKISEHKKMQKLLIYAKKYKGNTLLFVVYQGDDCEISFRPTVFSSRRNRIEIGKVIPFRCNDASKIFDLHIKEVVLFLTANALGLPNKLGLPNW